ncbi:MAG: hypothetical protein ACLTSO_11710 [Coprococcus sp.]
MQARVSGHDGGKRYGRSGADGDRQTCAFAFRLLKDGYVSKNVQALILAQPGAGGTDDR